MEQLKSGEAIPNGSWANGRELKQIMVLALPLILAQVVQMAMAAKCALQKPMVPSSHQQTDRQTDCIVFFIVVL